MPSGKVHNTINVVAGVTSVPFVGWFFDLPTTAAVFIGILWGTLMSPDMDLAENGNISIHVIRKRSRGLAFLWRWFWYPYGRMFTHRGISHVPVIGTLTRLVYFFPAWPVWWWLGDWTWPVVAGIIIADVLHVAADKIVSGVK